MKEKRLQQINEFIHLNTVVSMPELCKKFAISMSTLRRDINYLIEQNTILKVYGGVAAINYHLIPFENRDIINKTAKALLAKTAASLIEPNELIFIDSGTTTQDVFKYFPQTGQLTILTNNLDIINNVASLTNVNLLIIGNLFQHNTRSFVGSDTLTVLDKYNINKAFMAATGVSIENGLTNSDVQEYEIKKRVVEKAQQVYVLADASKFDHSALLTYAQLKDINGIITSEPLAEKYQIFCREHSIEIIISK